MKTLLKIAAGLSGLFLLLNGVAWLIAPAFAAKQLGMDLLGGVGLSTQIADLASFFLTAGGCILLGVATDRRVWLYPSIMLLGLAAAGRILAWAFHGAEFAAAMIAVEAVIAGLLVAASRKMT